MEHHGVLLVGCVEPTPVARGYHICWMIRRTLAVCSTPNNNLKARGVASARHSAWKKNENEQFQLTK